MTVRDVYPGVDDAFSIEREERGGASLVCDCPLKKHPEIMVREYHGRSKF